MTIEIATTDEEIHACYPIIAQLRPHIEPHELVDRVRDQERAGYQLIFIREEDQVVAIAGYRISLSLAWGRFLYVDDLVTAGLERSHGYGQQLMDWMLDKARQAKCDSFHLDSGVQRHAAHRFYFRNQLSITSHHFSMELED